MIIGIIGLGLIGGSFAKSIKSKTLHTVLATDKNAQTITKAKNSGVVDEILTPENISKCDVILVAISPSNAIEWLKIHAGKFSRNTVVVDLCGVKRAVCNEISPLACEYGFIFVGGHPMSGRELSGFENSKSDLFDGKSMILTPENKHDEKIIDKLKNFFLEVGFSKITISTPEEHDKIISYTSQLAHIISSAYVKCPDALKHHGFSAGSFRDMTRVAKADEKLWTELFLYNRDFLIEQLETVIKNMNEYLDALKENNSAQLEALFKKGREMKILSENN